MGKKQLQKITPWTKEDYTKNVLVFVFNILLITAMFIGAIFINGYTGYLGSPSIGEYFKTSKDQFFYLVLTLVLICFVMLVYLFFEDRNFIKEAKNTEMMFLIIEISLLASYFSGNYVDIYFRPLALGALLTLQLVNRRTAVFMNIVICLILFLMDVFTNVPSAAFGNAQYSSLVIGFTSGILGVYLLSNVTSRFKVLLKGFFICLPILLCLVLLEQTNLLVHWEIIILGASSGILSVVLFIVILPFFEFAFNKITTYKLSELTEHSAPLLKRMIEEAPGTFNHAVLVANIAESCATAIGEDALLARACAYYHDMGKLKQPEFFKENQADGINPHDELTPELSVNIIRAHVKDGAEILKKYHLPKPLVDVCLEHHGTMPIMYFYAKEKKFTDGEVDIEKFSYQGPKPQTKIAAIIMIADSAEAAVRTLGDRSRESVSKVIDAIINERMMLHQFDECEITMKEISIIKNTILNNLTGIYHKRIEYPKVNIDSLTGAHE